MSVRARTDLKEALTNPNTSFYRRNWGSPSRGHTGALPLRLPVHPSLWPSLSPKVTISQATASGSFTIFKESCLFFRKLSLFNLWEIPEHGDIQQKMRKHLFNVNFFSNLFSFNSLNALRESSHKPWGVTWFHSQAGYLFRDYWTMWLNFFFSSIFYSFMKGR